MFRFTRREQILLLALLVSVLFAVGVYTSQKPVSNGTNFPLQKAEPSELAKQSSSSSSSRLIKVDVKGSVHRPGVVSLPTDSRVADAIAAAGGTTDQADLNQVNLAAKLVDGGQVLIPDKQHSSAAGAAGTNASGAATGSSSGGKVDLNHATAAELDQLPGIGSSRAKAIVEYRESQGPFQSVDDLKKVKGFGDKLVDQLRDLVVVQ